MIQLRVLPQLGEQLGSPLRRQPRERRVHPHLDNVIVKVHLKAAKTALTLHTETRARLPICTRAHVEETVPPKKKSPAHYAWCFHQPGPAKKNYQKLHGLGAASGAIMPCTTIINADVFGTNEPRAWVHPSVFSLLWQRCVRHLHNVRRHVHLRAIDKAVVDPDEKRHRRRQHS